MVMELHKKIDSIEGATSARSEEVERRNDGQGRNVRLLLEDVNLGEVSLSKVNGGGDVMLGRQQAQFNEQFYSCGGSSPSTARSRHHDPSPSRRHQDHGHHWGRMSQGSGAQPSRLR